MPAIPILPTLVVLAVAGFASAGLQLISLSSLAAILLLAGAIGACIAAGQRAVHFLGQDEQVWVEGFTGAYVQNGPGVAVLNPLTYRSAIRRKAETLGNMDYVKVRDSLEGKERVEKGPQLFFLGAYEQVVERKQGLSLGSTEYAIVEARLSGERRVVKGPCMFFPGPHEDANKGTAVSLSRVEYLTVEEHAVCLLTAANAIS